MVSLLLWALGVFVYTGVAGVVGVGFYHLEDLATLSITDRAWRKFAGCLVGVLWPATAAPVMLMPLLSERHARMVRMRKEYDELSEQVRRELKR